MADALRSDHTPLPTARTSFVGREAQIDAARALLLEETVPLLTLTGPGGVGKTRLALALARAVAAHFADGVVFVDLAPLSDPAIVPNTVATALGVTSSADRPAADAIALHLRAHRHLLVLDNCEHLLVAVADLVAEQLSRCPTLQVLATSRAPLRVQGEQILPVPSLESTAAVTLFTQRARAVNPVFALDAADAAVVAEICHRLDGLPLAIELAAARVGLLPPLALLTLLRQQLPVLGAGPRDAPGRQRTLDDAIAWSYELLSAEEQTLFRRLAVFSGGCTLESAAAIGDLPVADTITRLEGLARQSLVRPGDGRPEPRFRMLETIRAFALQQLAAAGDEEVARRKHADYFLAMAEQADEALARTVEPALLDRVETDLDNLRAALEWFENVGDAEGLLRLAGALGRFWSLRSYRAEGIAWLERALARGQGMPGPRAKALVRLGVLANVARDHGRAVAAVEEGLALHRTLGDAGAVAEDLAMLGTVTNGAADYDRATAVLEEAIPLLVACGDEYRATMARYFFGLAIYGRGERARAATVLEDVVAASRAAGDLQNVSLALTSLGLVLTDLGEHARAARCLTESLGPVRQVGTTERLAGWLACVATLAAARQRPRAAARLLGAAEHMREAVGSQYAYPGRTRFEQAQTAVQRELGEAALHTAWSAGRALSRDDALTEAGTLLAELRSSDPSPVPDAVMTLTRRQQDVLRYLVEGATDQEIAAALSISPRTVGHHVGAILAKLGVETRRSARAFAVQHQVLTTDAFT